MKAPTTFEGKRLVYEEVFRSPFVRPTEASAQEVLNDIRAVHNRAYGWVEIEAHIEKKGDGYVAIRHHAKYE